MEFLSKKILLFKGGDVCVLFDADLDESLDLLTAVIFAKASQHDSFQTHMLCFDRKPVFWENRLSRINRLKCHDLSHCCAHFSSALPAGNSSAFEAEMTRLAKLSEFHDAERKLVILDSTFPMLTLQTPQAGRFCRILNAFLQDIGSGGGQCCLLMRHHSDFMDFDQPLLSFSTSSLSILSCAWDRHSNREYICLVNVSSKRENHINKKERLSVSSSDWSIRVAGSETEAKATRPPTAAHEPVISEINQLPFNLKLTDDELAARNRVKLPHVRGGGVIYYEPDEADDIDYEDPDE